MNPTSVAFLLVFVGGGLGSMLRHAVNQASGALFGVTFPFGTLIVNIVGSFCIGLFAGWFAHRGTGGHWPLFLTTGVLGGFTTFSAFSLDAALMWERHQPVTALLYALGSVAAGVIGVFAGLSIIRTLTGTEL